MDTLIGSEFLAGSVFETSLILAVVIEVQAFFTRGMMHTLQYHRSKMVTVVL